MIRLATTVTIGSGVKLTRLLLYLHVSVACANPYYLHGLQYQFVTHRGEVVTLHDVYHIAENFHKLVEIMFSQRKLLQIAHNSRKFSPSKISCCSRLLGLGAQLPMSCNSLEKLRYEVQPHVRFVNFGFYY